MRHLVVVALTLVGLAACNENRWVLENPPQSCTQMCSAWGMELAGIVGVGEQDTSSGSKGATACVCKVPGGAPGMAATVLAAAGYAALPPVIQEQQAAAQQQQQQAQPRH